MSTIDPGLKAEVEGTQYRKIYIQKLEPPPQVIKVMLERQKRKIPKNPVLRFFKIFFGEGY